MKVTAVKALAEYKIWVKFSDGVEGVVALNDLAGKGIFSFWNNYENFQKVYVDAETDAIAWNENLDICPTTVYQELTGKIKWNA
jgi:hypothetical protein